MMLAARFHGRGDIRLEKIEEPPCGKGEVKVFRPYRMLISKSIRSLLILYSVDEAGLCRNLW